jgi:hypothetical protein
MIRLLAGGGALAVLVVAGCAAGSGLNRPVAAPPAGSAPSRGTALQQSVITGRFVLFGTMGRPGPA